MFFSDLIVVHYFYFFLSTGHCCVCFFTRICRLYCGENVDQASPLYFHCVEM